MCIGSPASVCVCMCVCMCSPLRNIKFICPGGKYLCKISQGFAPAASPLLAGLLVDGLLMAGWDPRILSTRSVEGNGTAPRPHSYMQTAGSRILNRGYWIQDAGIKGCKCKDTRMHRIQDAGIADLVAPLSRGQRISRIK